MKEREKKLNVFVSHRITISLQFGAVMAKPNASFVTGDFF